MPEHLLRQGSRSVLKASSQEGLVEGKGFKHMVSPFKEEIE